jgi:hypothetical protein
VTTSVFSAGVSEEAKSAGKRAELRLFEKIHPGLPPMGLIMATPCGPQLRPQVDPNEQAPRSRQKEGRTKPTRSTKMALVRKPTGPIRRAAFR